MSDKAVGAKKETIENSVRGVAAELFSYCSNNRWAGWDPYDALNSRLFKIIPALDFKIPRLVITQLLKRSPINFRKPLLIPKTLNPKAMALFLASSIKLKAIDELEIDEIDHFIEKIALLRSPGQKYDCWGYSFPWQTRDRLVPRGAPNLVCTTFVANALLDAFEYEGDQNCLDMALSASEYIANKLYYGEKNDVAGFCYPTPQTRSGVHNANLLGASLLCRIHKHNGNKDYLEKAINVVKYSVSRQKSNGSWEYGESSAQGWIDNFHTGYNLCALQDIQKYTGLNEIQDCIEKGFQFYIDTFFNDNGAPGYFHDNQYPLDIHSAAQSIITLIKLKNYNPYSQELAFSVFQWSLKHLKSSKGYFYYQITPYYINKIPYIRWSQAWMLLATVTLLQNAKLDDNSRI